MNYTWSKMIDDVNSRNELGSSAAIANFFNRAADRGLSGNNIAHRWIGNTVWELPVGKGRPINIANPVMNAIIGGWSTGIILELRTGAPFGIVENSAAAVRPNVVGNYEQNANWRANVLRQPYFNTSVFVAPPALTFGNAGRTIAAGPGAVVGDFSLLKDFAMPWEGHKLQFRWESLNFMNHPNFASPTTGHSNPNFGLITKPASTNSVCTIGSRLPEKLTRRVAQDVLHVRRNARNRRSLVAALVVRPAGADVHRSIVAVRCCRH